MFMLVFATQRPLPIDERLFFLLVVCWILFVWVVALNITARVSGWTLLSHRFRNDSPWTGVSWNWQSARMRAGSSYNNCLVVGADLVGLYVRMHKIFSVGHAPLFIPWNEIQVRPMKSFLFIRRRTLLLGMTEQIPFAITESLAEKLRIAAGGSWPMESNA